MSRNGAIMEKLNQLTQTRAQRANLAAEKQAAIDRIVTPEIKAQLDALDREFTETEKDLDFTIGVLEAEIEDVSEVLGCYSLRVYESPSNLQSNRVTS